MDDLPFAANEEPSGPLSGLIVVDLTQMLAGPYCSMILADLGADVIKVEPPAGDPARRFAPFHPDDDVHAFGGYFQSVNRNKRSIVLDLKSTRGVRALHALLERSDVLVENFRVGVMDRLELSYEQLHERHPRLVYACIRGFGDPRTGISPYATRPAYDLTAQAMGGLMSITGFPDMPVKCGPGIGDIFPAAMSAIGILAAVLRSRETGRGQFVDVAMYDAVLALCERIVHQHSYTGDNAARHGNEHPLLSPFEVLEARDGFVTVAAPTDKEWVSVATVVGGTRLANDPRFGTSELRRDHHRELNSLLGEWAATLTRSEIVTALADVVAVGPVNDVEDILADPHVAARRMLLELPHPGIDHPIRIAGSPIKFANMSPRRVRPAPMLGQHTDEVLELIGMAPGDERGEFA